MRGLTLTCEWLVLAERVITDASTQTLTIVSCLEEVRALGFPSLHPGFAVAARYACVGDPPERPTRVRYRLVRAAVGEGEQVVAEFEGEWATGTRHARVVNNFQFLRLLGAGTLTFRLEHRVGRGAWTPGASASVDIVGVELSEEDRAAYEAERERLGLAAPG